MTMFLGSSILGAYNVTSEPSQILQSYDTSTVRMFVVTIDNFEGGDVTISTSSSSKWVGDVVVPVDKVKTADDNKWSAHYIGASNKTRGGIVYSGGDSVLIRCGPDRNYNPSKPTDWVPSTIEIKPFTEEENAVEGDLVLSFPGGEGIFNEWSPYLGNSVYAMDGSGKWSTIDTYFTSANRTAPKRFMIDVQKPLEKISYVEIENWVKDQTLKGDVMESNGRVYAKRADGQREHIGNVLQRASTHSNIHGTEYTQIGQLSSTDPGSLILSTSRWYGLIDEKEDSQLRGGIKISALNHARYMTYVQDADDYIGDSSTIVIGSLSSTKEDLVNEEYTSENGDFPKPPMIGLPPIFCGYTRPYFDRDNYGASFHFYVSDDFGRTWRITSEVNGDNTESSESPINYWTNIRIMIGR